MRHITGVVLIACTIGLKAQEVSTSPPASQLDTTQNATDSSPQPATARQLNPSGPVSPFYHPPVIREVWNRFYHQVDTLDEQALTRRYVRTLLDSLRGTIQADFDSLAVRARAFETRERGYTHRFYRSPMTRDEILGTPISEREAEDQPHFHAVYDPQGYLLRVRYVEPRRWRAQQELLARGTFQSEPGAPPLVRYFKSWDVRYLKPVDYTRKKKMPEGEAFVRVIYDQSDRIESLQRYSLRGELEYSLTFGRMASDSSGYVRLEFAGDSSGSLLSIHPYIYLPDWSVVKPGWKVAITRDVNGNLASTQVFNNLNQISYYYTFSLQIDPEANTRTLQGTVLSDADSIKRIFALFYDGNDRMIRRSFYTAEGELRESTTYDYHPKSSELVVITRNAAGTVISRQRFVDPTFWY
ncbi:MAG: hypothetical protein JSW54_12645 [Fidelibacterota bacterium]|nr:MAG: hypothetical protein JSW54_12645 [Candidatus Neomarinimicrobiota bacterium]